MKNLILILIPLLFLGCKKDDLPIEVSEGTRLVKQEIYLQGTTLYKEPDFLRRFYYGKNGKLIQMEMYDRDLLKPIMRTEKKIDELGNLTLMKFFAERGEETMTMDSYNEIYTNPETELIEKISFFSIIDDTGILKKTDERHLVYDDYHQLVADTVNLKHVSGSHSGLPTNFQYHWKNENVVKIEKFDVDEKLVEVVLIEYDNSKNYRTWDLMRDGFTLYHNLIPKGKNNIIKVERFEFGAFRSSPTCNPCKTTYRYNSFGLPYFSRTEYGKRVVYTYEKE
ncbi:MAG: hypothetical protein EA362_08165 [Saprospirales bacterium]|nr:MAG: hypothetical protein EA362_08165 [Saprospirales bacterium]